MAQSFFLRFFRAGTEMINKYARNGSTLNKKGVFFLVFGSNDVFVVLKDFKYASVNASLRWYINVSCLFLSFLLITSGV